VYRRLIIWRKSPGKPQKTVSYFARYQNFPDHQAELTFPIVGGLDVC